MFERTLQDLIRGLRAHKASSRAQEDAFIAGAMTEIREELKGKDMALKAEAVLKMCYLMMLYPISPPTGFAFHVVETMSSARFHLKQLGYMASPMAFTGESEEVVLTVNGIKKDLLSPHVAIPPLALSALPHLLSLSPSLAHTLHPDLLLLLTHSTPRIRKRAVLCLLPCWEAYPDGLREGFPRLRERLLDEDQSVVGATVGVVMELARRQGGRNYLPLAPELFGILTGSSNNWMLIKVVKLFAILTPLEPRLVRKLLPPLTNLISSTSAISLLYECVRTCIVGGMLDPDRPEGEALARVCIEKLGGYLRDEGGDQNLRYIALLAMVKITPTHPHLVSEYQEEILESLEDADLSIRMRALELITAMTDRENLQSIVDQILTHLAPPEEDKTALPSALASLSAAAGKPKVADATVTAQNISTSPSYRLLLSQRLLDIIEHDTYVNVTDFQWVVSVLVDVAYVSHVDIGDRARDMLLDVVGRVRSVRSYAVRVLEKVLNDDELRERVRDKTGEDGLMSAAVWICGEYSSDLSSPLSAISSILSLDTTSPDSLVSLSLQAAAKVFATYTADISDKWTAELYTECKNVVASVRSGLEPFLSSKNIEVQERAFELTQLLAFVNADLNNHVPPKKAPVRAQLDPIPGMDSGFEDMSGEKKEDTGGEPPYPKSLFLFQPLFATHELNSLAHMAQEAVPIPEGLNLDMDIVAFGGFGNVGDDDDAESEAEKEQELDLGSGGGGGMEELRRVLREQDKAKKKKKLSPEDKAERARRKAARREKLKNDPYYLFDKNDDVNDMGVDDIPIVHLDDDEMAAADSPPSTKVSKGKKKKATPAPPPDFDRAGEMPEGAVAPKAKAQVQLSGLAAVDLYAATPVARSRPARYDEYTLDDDDAPAPSPAPVAVSSSRASSKPASMRSGSPLKAASTSPSPPPVAAVAESPSVADVPVDSVQAVKVTKVKKKKKRAAAAVA